MERYTDNISRRQIRHTFDALLEGIQVIDFSWRYLFANTAIIGDNDSDKAAMRTQTIMERYPGIETTEVFEALQECMLRRKPEQLEIEFIYPDLAERWFELSIVPVEEGICIMSLDITAHKLAEEKADKATRLYAFVSQVNQNIVRVKDEKALFSNSCTIAVEYGKFAMAWIGLFDPKNNKISMLDQCGMEEDELGLFMETAYLSKSPQKYVLQNDTYYICNDIVSDNELILWKPFAIKHNLNSCLVLPIRKSGKIIGTFNLYSTKINFSNKEEIALMMEMAGDISYALDLLEKATQQLHTEELLAKSEKRFRVLIEKGLDIKTLSRMNGEIFYASPSIKKILGYSSKEFISLPLMAIYHPEDVMAFSKIRQKLLQTPGKSIRQQARLLHKNGNWVWCEGTMTNMLHEAGIEALVSNFRDISEKKADMLQREFDRNNLNALINNTTDLMWSVDADFNLITSNRPFDDMIRATTGKVLKHGDNTLFAALSDGEHNRFRNFYERAFLGGAFTVTEYMETPVESWNEISFFPIRKENEVIGTACYAHNITERKKAELVLENQNKELIKTNDELDRFVYSVSHDLRSPLTSIMGIISFIEEDSTEPETLGHLKMIKDSINRLDRSVKSILSYSHNNRGGLEITAIPVQNSINEIVYSLSSMSNAAGISFEVQIDEKRPFYSDCLRFKTIIENLVSNAIKYHTKATGGRFLHIKGTSGKDYLELELQDNGIGISPANHQKIFGMFYRISGEISGSGLGLYIVKETLEKLHGTILIDSEEGKGTKFTLKLKNLR